MAQVGQTTPSGGREWALHRTLGACRQVVVPESCTLNHIGCWLREQFTVNSNNVRAAIYTTAGVLLYETSILTAGVNSTVTFSEYQLNFSGQGLSAGTYILAIAASETDGNVILQGQNDSAGLPSYIVGDDPPTLHPDFPSDASAALRSDSTRQWDMYLDYTPGGAPVTGSGEVGTATTVAPAGTASSARSVSVTLRSGSGILLDTVSRRFWTRTTLDAAATDGGAGGLSFTCNSLGVFTLTGLDVSSGAGWLTYKDPADDLNCHVVPVTFV